MRPRSSFKTSFLSLLASLPTLVGCSGMVGTNPGSGGSSATGAAGTSVAGAAGQTGAGGTTMTTGSGGTTTTTGTAGASGLASCPTTSVTPTPLRRLTKFEYANSVKNLLGVDPAPANDLPADEVTDGFNNNAGVLTVSSLHAEKYVLVSEALAKAAVTSNLTAVTGSCSTTSKGEDACAMEFATNFGRRAFRRPTTAEDRAVLMAAYTAGKTGGSYAEGIEVMIRAALQSAHFLYRLEMTSPTSTAAMVPLSQYELATRLSYLVWASGPDDALLDAAGRNELATKEAVAAKARAMLDDPKARIAITDFYKQWIGTSRLDTMTKSATLFPSYSSAVRDGMKLETPAFIEYVLWTGDHKLSTLLTSPISFVNNALAPIYGVAAPSGSNATTAKMVTLPAAQGRSGILTQAGFLAVQAHPDQTSPVLRGKFVRTAMMCQPPPAPPMDVNITVPAPGSGKTARERFAAHLTAGTSCMTCHQMMDPVGLTFESFDAIGAYRTAENGVTIDLSGNVVGARDAGLNGAFTGVRELGTKLAASDQVRDCVATQWFRFSVGRGEDAPDGCSLTTLQDSFGASGGDLRELVVAMTQTDAFWYRAPVTP